MEKRERGWTGRTRINASGYTPAIQIRLSYYWFIASFLESGPTLSSLMYLQGLRNSQFSVKFVVWMNKLIDVHVDICGLCILHLFLEKITSMFKGEKSEKRTHNRWQISWVWVFERQKLQLVYVGCSIELVRGVLASIKYRARAKTHHDLITSLFLM